MANLAHPDVVYDDRPDAVDDDDDDVEEESHAVTLHLTMAPTFDVNMSCIAQSQSQCTTSGMPSGDSTLPESQSRGPSSSSSPPSPSPSPPLRCRCRRRRRCRLRCRRCDGGPVAPRCATPTCDRRPLPPSPVARRTSTGSRGVTTNETTPPVGIPRRRDTPPPPSLSVSVVLVLVRRGAFVVG
jgi:hypothetical protein